MKNNLGTYVGNIYGIDPAFEYAMPCFESVNNSLDYKDGTRSSWAKVSKFITGKRE